MLNVERRMSNPVYVAWYNMRQRCQNPNHKNFDRYGGRGIEIDPRWDDFECFAVDMGPRPNGHSLDRINNDLDYSPANCKWSTSLEQTNNRSSNLMLTHNGQTMSAADWDRHLGFRKNTINKRLRQLGWTVERALTTPVRRRPRPEPSDA